MQRWKVGIGAARRDHVVGRRALGGSSGRFRGGVIGVGLLSAIVTAGHGVAQTPPAVALARLTVRPHEMATGTKNPAAGEYLLDSLPEMTPEVRAHPYLVYVPARCAGAHRCPLHVHLHGGGDMFRATADKYGIIMLMPTAANKNWAVTGPDDGLEPDRKNIDAALQQVLRKFAIDPDKIAISGVSQGTWPTEMLGGANMNVFSRIITFGGAAPLQWLDPPTETTEFLTINEFPFAGGWIWAVRDMQRAGYRVKHIAALAGHGVYASTAEFVAQWLQESWAQPNLAARRAPQVVTSLPVLTPRALSQLTSVWESINIPLEQRIASMREVIVPVVTEQPSTVMMDMAAAAKSPAVAAALEKAGLTAEQFDAYRVALLSARLTLQSAENPPLPTWLMSMSASALPTDKVDPASVLGQNVAFLKAHPNEVRATDRRFLDGP